MVRPILLIIGKRFPLVLRSDSYIRTQSQEILMVQPVKTGQVIR